MDFIDAKWKPEGNEEDQKVLQGFKKAFRGFLLSKAGLSFEKFLTFVVETLEENGSIKTGKKFAKYVVEREVEKFYQKSERLSKLSPPIFEKYYKEYLEIIAALKKFLPDLFDRTFTRFPEEFRSKYLDILHCVSI